MKNIILHIKLTEKEGGEMLTDRKNLCDTINDLAKTKLFTLISHRLGSGEEWFFLSTQESFVRMLRSSLVHPERLRLWVYPLEAPSQQSGAQDAGLPAIDTFAVLPLK